MPAGFASASARPIFNAGPETRARGSSPRPNFRGLQHPLAGLCLGLKPGVVVAERRQRANILHEETVTAEDIRVKRRPAMHDRESLPSARGLGSDIGRRKKKLRRRRDAAPPRPPRHRGCHRRGESGPRTPRRRRTAARGRVPRAVRSARVEVPSRSARLLSTPGVLRRVRRAAPRRQRSGPDRGRRSAECRPEACRSQSRAADAAAGGRPRARSRFETAASSPRGRVVPRAHAAQPPRHPLRDHLRPYPVAPSPLPSVSPHEPTAYRARTKPGFTPTAAPSRRW